MIIVVAVLAITAGAAVGWTLSTHRRVARRDRPLPVRRILLPFTGHAISRRAFEAAVRLARAEDATIMPAYLARIPMSLPLDTPVPTQCSAGMPLLETIEQQASALGVAVDARVSRGRSYRHALRRLLAQESFDRIIISAQLHAEEGFTAEDMRWLLEDVPAEVLVLRPAPADERRIQAKVAGHF